MLIKLMEQFIGILFLKLVIKFLFVLGIYQFLVFVLHGPLPPGAELFDTWKVPRLLSVVLRDVSISSKLHLEV